VSALPERPISILIAALGGEGGGVLADWLVDAAAAAGFPVQATSIPGVSQRTGATTYYVEVFPATEAELSGRQPVMALVPSPGNIDLMVASELVEAGRAIQNGYVSPDRTTLIASTHRIYATGEKLPLGDGRYDAGAVAGAARQLAKRPILFDMARLARDSDSVINSVLFGAMSGCGVLPLSRASCEAAIQRAGKGETASLRGFTAGFEAATGGLVAPTGGGAFAPVAAPGRMPAELGARISERFPAELREVLDAGVRRLIDYLDEAYATQYLDRVAAVLDSQQGASGATGAARHSDLAAEVARYLALWMPFEDIIRVADLKTRPARFERVRREVGAAPDEPLAVVDYFKPGLGELADVLPPGLAARARRRAEARASVKSMHGGWQIRSNAPAGFLALRALARLKRWRRRTARFAEEQASIERWLSAVRRFASAEREIALEVAHCARLIKGYGDTRVRGRASFERVFVQLIEADRPAAGLAGEIRRAREAALADAEGIALARALGQARADATAPSRIQTVTFMPRPRNSAR
jgi:indolepyruvate ferredoxin oxidoreductase beta subunit